MQGRDARRQLLVSMEKVLLLILASEIAIINDLHCPTPDAHLWSLKHGLEPFWHRLTAGSMMMESCDFIAFIATRVIDGHFEHVLPQSALISFSKSFGHILAGTKL